MIIFNGADVPSNRLILEGMGVQDFGVNYWRLKQRGLPTTKPYLFEGRFQDGVNIHLDLGAEKSSILYGKDLQDYLNLVLAFVANNAERITTCTDHPELPVQSLIDILGPSRVIIVWSPQSGYKRLRELAAAHQHIGIPGSGIESDTTLVGHLLPLRGNVLHAIACAKPDTLTSVRFESASTLSWLSPMLRGETVVWDGNRVLRYPKKMKDQARSRYKAVTERAGLDYKKILDDDAIEVTKLAIWSYLRFGEHMDKKNRFIVNNREELDTPLNEETPDLDVNNKGVEMRKPSGLMKQREPHEMSVIPVMGFTQKTIKETNKDGLEVEREVSHVASGTVSLRQCDTCVLASNCPMFRPESSCAFNLPVQFESTDQVRSMLTVLLEMQAGRIAFTKFAEELNGGYPDPNLSQEMDRYFKMVERLKVIESDSSYMKITVEGKSNSPGVLSRLFGEMPKELPRSFTPKESDALLLDVIEGEVVEN